VNLKLETWNTIQRGSGVLQLTEHTLKFVNRHSSARRYSNAQIDDYQGLPRRKFLWQPPLTLTVRARFSHPAGELRGTAGFGFWNDPFLMTGWRMPALPRAVWFFYASPPSKLPLALGVPDFGWKAATIDAACWQFAALMPLAPIAVPLMNIPALYRRWWRVGQQAAHICETVIAPPMTDWHTYSIRWQPDTVHFSVDDQIVLNTDFSPRGRLGFVMWLDNQYLVATPWGRFCWGLLETSAEQWMEAGQLKIKNE